MPGRKLPATPLPAEVTVEYMEDFIRSFPIPLARETTNRGDGK